MSSAHPNRPEASSPAVKTRMARQKTRDTAPELAVRRAVHAMGLRYFTDRAPLPGLRRRADMVFPRQQVAVFIHGCWWHGCTVHRSLPKSNSDWWAQKIESNVQRDEDTVSRLEDAGWKCVVAWEHDDPEQVAQAIHTAVDSARKA